MKRNKFGKKLTLNRETVRRLNATALRRANGGLENQLFGTKFVCGSKRCTGSDWTCKAGTCTSCDGPMSCDVICEDTEPLPQ